MLENGVILLTAIFSLLFMIAPLIVNAFYQRRAQRLADELLKGNNEEYNRQIRANAVIVLVRRSFWAGFVFLIAFLYYREFLADGLGSWLVGTILLGLGCLAFGVFGYRSELKKIKTLE